MDRTKKPTPLFGKPKLYPVDWATVHVLAFNGKWYPAEVHWTGRYPWLMSIAGTVSPNLAVEIRHAPDDAGRAESLMQHLTNGGYKHVATAENPPPPTTAQKGISDENKGQAEAAGDRRDAGEPKRKRTRRAADSN